MHQKPALCLVREYFGSGLPSPTTISDGRLAGRLRSPGTDSSGGQRNFGILLRLAALQELAQKVDDIVV